MMDCNNNDNGDNIATKSTPLFANKQICIVPESLEEC